MKHKKYIKALRHRALILRDRVSRAPAESPFVEQWDLRAAFLEDAAAVLVLVDNPDLMGGD